MRIQWVILGKKVSNLVFRHNPKTLGAGHEQFGICPHQSQHCKLHTIYGYFYLVVTDFILMANPTYVVQI